MRTNSSLRLRALEIADEVRDAVERAGPNGLRFVDGALLVDMAYADFHAAAHELAALGIVKVGRGGDGHRNRVLRLDAVEPVERLLSDQQRIVLNYLHSICDEYGLAQASIGKISKATGIKAPQFCLQRLDIKGYIDFADVGGPTRAATFKVYPDGAGQKSDTWWRIKYGRVPTREWLMERGYTTLSNKEHCDGKAD